MADFEYGKNVGAEEVKRALDFMDSILPKLKALSEKKAQKENLESNYK